MRALQAHQPEIKKIQEKYKDDRQRQQREMMAFYQENKINPFASCVPLLLQLPVFMSLFYLLRSDEFSQELAASGDPSFLGVTLDEKATGAALIILIGLYFLTMVGSTSIMAASAEGNQRLMMYALPGLLHAVRDQLPRRPDHLLDHDQPVDDGAAMGGEAGDSAPAEADRSRGAGDEGPTASAAQEETTPLTRFVRGGSGARPSPMPSLALAEPIYFDLLPASPAQ